MALQRVLTTTLATIWLLSALTACVPYGDQPLTAIGEQELDGDLMGSWYWQQENETGYLHFGREDKSGLLQVIMVDRGQDKELDMSQFTGLTSRLKSGRYLSLRQQPAGEGEPGYIYIKYRQEGDFLAISLMDGSIVSKAIKSGELKGDIGPDKRLAEHITADQSSLQKFIIANDEQLFAEFSPLRRLELPAVDVVMEKTFAYGTKVDYTISLPTDPRKVRLRFSQRLKTADSNQVDYSNLSLRFELGPKKRYFSEAEQQEMVTRMMDRLHVELGHNLQLESFNSAGYLGVKEVEKKAIIAFSNFSPWQEYLANQQGMPQWQAYKMISEQWRQAKVFTYLVEIFQGLGYEARLSGFEKLFVMKVADSPFAAELEKEGVRAEQLYPAPGVISFSLRKLQDIPK